MTICRAISGLLFFGIGVIVAAMAHAEPNASFPFWGETTSRLNVRQEDRVVATLDKGTRVYILGEERPGWYSIAYDDDLGTSHKVAAKYVRRLTAHQTQAATQEPMIGLRRFYVLVKPYSDYVGDEKYPSLTAFDILRQENDTITVLGRDGERITIADTANNGMRLSAVPWDYARDIPYGKDYPDQLVQWYYHFITTMLTQWWFFVALLLALTIYAGFAALGSDSPIVQTLIIVVLALLTFFLVGADVGRAHLRYLDIYERTAEWLAPYRFDKGLFLPVDYRIIDPTDRAEWARGMWYSLGIIVWVPFFLAAHLLFLYYLPSACRAAHYVLARHPAEKHVTALAPIGQLTQRVAGALQDRARRPINWTPLFVLRNLERRLKTKKDFLRAERELLDEAIELDRKKAEYQDRRSHHVR